MELVGEGTREGPVTPATSVPPHWTSAVLVRTGTDDGTREPHPIQFAGNACSSAPHAITHTNALRSNRSNTSFHLFVPPKSSAQTGDYRRSTKTFIIQGQTEGPQRLPDQEGADTYCIIDSYLATRHQPLPRPDPHFPGQPLLRLSPLELRPERLE